jgi:hypothetical protein
MSGAAGTALWRVFPWDPAAAPGHPFSPSFAPEPTGRGRFDLPTRLSSVLYLAETPEHAVAELLHPWQGRAIDERHLRRGGRQLAAVPITPADSRGSVVDLCDPGVLLGLDLAPDRVASRLRAVTQPIARRVWDSGAPGLRWWSRFWGDWHTTVCFLARSPVGGATPALRFGTPEPLDLTAAAVVAAADLLGIELLQHTS